MRHCLVLIVLVVASACAWTEVAFAQSVSGSTMVVVIVGDRQYHQPGCPLVAKAGSHVKVMKLAEARAQGLTAHDCEGAVIDQPRKDANAAAVFVEAGDKRYHKAGCPKLGSNPTKLSLGDAGKKYWPCPVCKPPIRQREKS
jgi:hypothetical protein